MAYVERGYRKHRQGAEVVREFMMNFYKYEIRIFIRTGKLD